MKTKQWIRFLALSLLTVALPWRLPAATLSTAFTYQGRLVAGGSPANGPFDLRLALYNLSVGGSQVGNTLTNIGVAVSNGLFTTTVDFLNPAIFDGTTYWLEVAVRPSGTANPFRTLPPRQRLAGSPYALFAASAGGAPWSGLTGVPAGFADGVDNDILYTASVGLTLNAQNQFSVNFSGSGAASTAAHSDHTHSAFEVFSIVLDNDGPGSLLNADFLDGLDSTGFWQLGGNSGIIPGTHFLGTTGPQPLEFRVDNVRALLLDPHATSPNIIGGYRGNFVSASAVGATIAGGGTSDDGSGNVRTNRVTSNYGTVGGGFGNSVSGANATIGGGERNTIQTSAPYGTIGGGRQNTIQPAATNATIPGGFGASATNYGQFAYASGSFATAGDAQMSLFVLRGTTTPASPSVEIFLDGSSQRMRIPQGGRWVFEILLIGSMASADAAAFQIRGAIKNLSGTTSFLGAPLVTTVASEGLGSGWSVAVAADNSNDALAITVTGGTGGTVRWVATTRLTQLIF